MFDDPTYEQLLEISWQRKLTPAEEAQLSRWLATHPELQVDWEEEACLNDALGSLPNVSVPSNFTSRVVAAAERDSAQAGRATKAQRSWWVPFLPKLALGTLILAAGLLSYNHIQTSRRAEWVQSLTTVSQVSPIPNPEILKDFDAIAALGSTPPADEELLKLMQ